MPRKKQHRVLRAKLAITLPTRQVEVLEKIAVRECEALSQTITRIIGLWLWEKYPNLMQDEDSLKDKDQIAVYDKAEE